MIEALWSVELSSSLGIAGNGVAVFESGRVLGGDSTKTYVGSYGVSGGIVDVEIAVNIYANAPGVVSAIGANNFVIKVSGPFHDKDMQLAGYVLGDPSKTITIHAVRRAELP